VSIWRSMPSGQLGYVGRSGGIEFLNEWELRGQAWLDEDFYESRLAGGGLPSGDAGEEQEMGTMPFLRRRANGEGS
jgi:hypothetical protein